MGDTGDTSSIKGDLEEIQRDPWKIKGRSGGNAERYWGNIGGTGGNIGGLEKDTGRSKEMKRFWGYSTVEICCAKKIPFSFIELAREEIFCPPDGRFRRNTGDIQGDPR
jgi:hypothetical protein